MSHPPFAHNPHVYTDLTGNTVTAHTTDGTPAPTDAELREGEQWQEPETLDGTDSSTSSSTETTSSPTPEPSTQSPAPTTEPPSEQDQTTRSTAPSATGDGTAAKTAHSRRSTAKSK